MIWTDLSHFGSASPLHHRYQVSKDPVPEWIDLDGAFVWRWSRLMPGGFILPHVDRGPYHRRVHWPVEPGGVWWDSRRGLCEAPREPYEVRHFEPHAVWNAGSTPRVIVCVDYTEVVCDPADQVICDWDPADFPVLAKLSSDATK